MFCMAVTGACIFTPALAQTTNAPGAVKLRPVVVSGVAGSLHDVASESERVGPAAQPEWTARRAFAETDIYVIPSGEIEFNQFCVSTHPRHGKPENSFESEFEFGLPWRTQFDVELNYSANSGRGHYDSTLIELPHALADWGRIPLNPAVDAGWLFNTDEPDAWFGRLLLAEEFGERVHFGANLSFERQISGELETAYELNVAANYVVIPFRLAVGAELLVEHEIARESELDEEGEIETETVRSTAVMLGPSVLYKPTRNTHLGLVTLFGLTHDAPAVEAFLVFGIDLEPFTNRSSNHGDAGGDIGGLGPIRRRR